MYLALVGHLGGALGTYGFPATAHRGPNVRDVMGKALGEGGEAQAELARAPGPDGLVGLSERKSPL